MPDRQVRSADSIFEPDGVTAEVFRLLLDRHPALVPLDDLIREYRFPPDIDRDAPAIFVTEAVERLYHDGLAHRIGDFAFASRAGVRALELWT
jgi:hypothetical protein